MKKSVFSILKKLFIAGRRPRPAQRDNNYAAKKPSDDDSPVLARRLQLIKERLGESNDIIVRKFAAAGTG